MAHLNFTVLGPGSDPMALLDAIGKNNAANEAKAGGKYDEAIALHKQALEAKIEAHGVESVHSALSSNALMEARGNFEGAREIRLKGADKGHAMCGNLNCVTPGGAMLSRSQLKGCGQCRSVFYCSTVCQKKDWITRHKHLCKKYMASRAPANSTG